MDQINENTQQQKPKIPKMAIASPLVVILGFLTAVGLVVLVLMLGRETNRADFLINVAFVVYLVSSVLGLIFGIVAYDEIRRNKGLLKGRIFSISGIILGFLPFISFVLFIILMPPARSAPSQKEFRARFASELAGLGKAIQAYSDSYEKYPTPDIWSDLLIEHAEDVDKRKIRAYCHIFALNPNCFPNSPNDVVLLFEANFDPNLNQFGGPELLFPERYGGEGCHVLFNNGEVKFIKTKHLSELRWDNKSKDNSTITASLSAKTAEKLVREGHDKYCKRNYDEAIALYTEAIELKPDAYMYYGYRGDAYLTIKEYDKAIDDFSKQIDLDANSFQGYQNRARTYFEKKDYDNAIKDFNKLIDFKHGYFSPGFLNATTFRELAGCYAAKGNFAKALECCDKSIEMVDKFPGEAGRGNFKRAVIYEQMRNYDKALADYTEAIKLNAAKQGRNDPYAGGPCYDSDFDFSQANYFYARGALCQKKGDLDKALEDFNQALKHNKLHPKVYKNRALVYMARNELKKSLADKARAESLRESFGEEFNKISTPEPRQQELSQKKIQKLSEQQVEEVLFKYFAEKKKQIDDQNITFGNITDVTDEELYSRMGLQIFNFNATWPFLGEQRQSLVAKSKEVIFLIANSGLMAETGVTSYCVADMDKDEKPELFFTHSGGSGIHRTMIEMLRWDDTSYAVGEVAVIYDLTIVIKKVDDQNIEFGEPTSWLCMLGNPADKNQEINKMGALRLRDGKYHIDFTEDASQKLRPHDKESYKEGVVWSPKQVELLDSE